MHTSATVVVAGGRLLRRSSTSDERAQDVQHDAASEVAHTASVEEARSGGNEKMASLALPAMVDGAISVAGAMESAREEWGSRHPLWRR